MLTFEALGTGWKIKANDFDVVAEKNKILSVVTEFENNYSRFKKTSYVGRLNTGSSINQPPSELYEMLEFAYRAYQNTQGMFNIFIGATLENSGYGLKNNNKFSNAFSGAISFSEQEIKLTGEHSIDLGGFGKGWLIDKLALILQDKSDNFVINGGGDMYVKGKKIVQIESTGHKVGVEDQAVASSSAAARAWRFGGVQHTHIPSAQSEHQASVIAGDAKTADMLATVSLLSNNAQLKSLEKSYKAKIMLVQGSDIIYCSKAEFFNMNI
ncbi:TPA: FAD:protein FMN transferase [Candidatus Saccharibacteria bacterium]|nr:FAD:protein FMN transferase [Candidatus Saccharibacteria bacterium]HIO87607.1 FAD:protein FMN transferase [Candidatus Saccharibacteria bacterium]